MITTGEAYNREAETLQLFAHLTQSCYRFAARVVTIRGRKSKLAQTFSIITQENMDKGQIQEGLAKALEHNSAGRHREAEQICQHLLMQDPQNLGVLVLIGSIHKKDKNLLQALHYFEKAQEINPTFIPVLGNLGDIYKATGRYPDALRCYEHIVQLEPKNALAYFNLAMVFLTLGRFSDAILNYQKVLTMHPELPAAHSNIGFALVELGRVEEARTSFDKALAIAPNSSDTHYNRHATVFDDKDPWPAISALEAALKADPENHDARIYMAMLMDFAGDSKAAEEHFAFIRCNVKHSIDKIDSWDYIKSHLTPEIRIFSITRHALEYSFGKAELDGLILEFGVRTGVSINMLANLTHQNIYGFDSFEGLPEQWETMPAGALSTFKQFPVVPDHVHLQVGWFEDSLPGFIEKHSGPVRFMNIDCDIYSSTKTVFRYLGDRIVPGTVIIFDEYLCNPGWRDNEYKAFQEFIAENGLRYEYILFSPLTKQTAVIIVG